MASKVLQTEPSHFKLLEAREHEQQYYLNEMSEDMLRIMCESCHMRTYFIDGRIITIGGLSNIHGDTWEIWQFPSIYVEEYAVQYAAAVKEYVEAFAEIKDIKRLQSPCPDDPLHTRWMEFLGFEKEGVLRKYCGDKDHIMWAKIMERE